MLRRSRLAFPVRTHPRHDATKRLHGRGEVGVGEALVDRQHDARLEDVLGDRAQAGLVLQRRERVRRAVVEGAVIREQRIFVNRPRDVMGPDGQAFLLLSLGEFIRVRAVRKRVQLIR